MHCLILGFGDIGTQLAQQLSQQGHTVTAISRRPQILKNIAHLCQNVLALDLKQCAPIDQVFVILSPDERSVSGYQHCFIDSALPIFTALTSHPVQRILLVSSTRIYGEDNGQWCDDNSPIQPNDALGYCLFAMENLWRAYWGDRLCILRPSGLYRADSPRLKKLALQATETITTTHWTNRFHRDDLIHFLSYTLTLEQLQASYILSDQKPCLQHKVFNFIREQHHYPRLIEDEDIEFKQSGKRLNAIRLQQSGYPLRYSDFFATQNAI